MGDVRHRDDHDAIGAEAPVELDEHAQRIHEVLEHVAVHDDVERPLAQRDLAIEIQRDHPLAVARSGLGESRIALDRGHAPSPLGELAAQQAVGRADVEQPPALAGAQPAQDHRVTAVRVRLEHVPG